MTIVIEGCAIATMDGAWTEHSSGHIAIEGNRIESVAPGSAPRAPESALRIDGEGCLATPGLVNCHHHLYQWLTRGMAQQATLFEWLESLYPVWAHIDAELEAAAARAGLAALALSGCSTSSDHHYIFPKGREGLLEAAIDAAATVGLRFEVGRGSMDLGRSDGGLPPDEIVEDTDEILEDTESFIERYHDDSFGALVRVAVAPCSPFSATAELMKESAELARRHRVRLHTHLAETQDEEDFCLERFGVRPVEYLEKLGWLGEDVWLAHCVHLSASEVALFGSSGTGVAHCPSSNARLGAGIAPVSDLVAAGAPVGLGVDGAASNEAGELAAEVRGALQLARLRGGPGSMSARQALALATTEGARCLGRSAEIGSLEAGKLADVALWRMDGLDRRGIQDPVAALVLGASPPVDTLVVDGDIVVRNGRLETEDEGAIAGALEAASLELRARAEADA